MRNPELWVRLGKEGKFVAFRTEASTKQPTGLVFKLKEGEVIIRPKNEGYLKIEPYFEWKKYSVID